jgi:hypothetical protein
MYSLMSIIFMPEGMAQCFFMAEPGKRAGIVNTFLERKV